METLADRDFLKSAVLAALALTIVSACEPPDVGRTEDAPASALLLPRALWVDETDQVLDSTAQWTNKVELADVDGDGRLDLLFANGGDYSTPGEAEMNRVFLNRGPGERFVEATRDVFGSDADLTRVIKARDFDGDGLIDVFVGNTYQTPSRLFLATGGGHFVERSESHLPRIALSVGDVEPGDVDGDGDLDLVLADWGPGNNMVNSGGRTRLWLNDGSGRFRDATADQMPETLVRFSWDLELVDVDNDYDLDVLVSCKRCAGSKLFRNGGAGDFEEDPRGMPQYTNNYELEAMDLDGDGYLDLVTINDGEIVDERGSSRREHVFRNNGEGSYLDATDAWWPDAENIGEDDNVVAFLDFDSDGDADFLVGSLSGPDRLLINDGEGGLRSANDVFTGEATPGTLGMAISDLDGDHRIDVVQAQGEHRTAVQERIFFGRGLVPDHAPPVVSMATSVVRDDGALVRARIHDRKSPTLATEWSRVEVRWVVGGDQASTPMSWYGEYLWRAIVPAGATEIEICAVDAAGNETCQEVATSG